MYTNYRPHSYRQTCTRIDIDVHKLQTDLYKDRQMYTNYRPHSYRQTCTRIDIDVHKLQTTQLQTDLYKDRHRCTQTITNMAIVSASGLTCYFSAHQILSFPQMSQNKVILNESLNFTYNDHCPVTCVQCNACV